MSRRLAPAFFLSLLSLCASAERLHRDPVPIPVEVVNQLRKEGVAQSVQLGQSAAKAVETQEQQLVDVIVDPSANERDKIGKLRKQIQSLTEFQSKFEKGDHYYRSDADGRQKAVRLNSDVKGKITARIQSLKDQLYQLEQANVKPEDVRQQLDPEMREASTERTQFYDLRKRQIDITPNIQNVDENVEPERIEHFFQNQNRPDYFLIEKQDAPERGEDETSWLINFGAKALYSVLSLVVPSAHAAPPPVSNDIITRSCYEGSLAERDAALAADLNLAAYQIGDEPEFHALAEELNYSPIKIYEYLTNEWDYELYKGGVQGALATLKAKRGNDIDHASLMIALLRASNIPARYVSGDILLENRKEHYHWHKMLNFYGMNTANSKNGKIRESENIDRNGRLHKRTEHVWVEACVPYASYRGTKVANSGYRWVAMDASFKRYIPKEGLEVSATFDYDEYLSTRTKKLPLEIFVDELIEQAKTVQDDATLADIGTTWEKQRVAFEYLPDSLPYGVYQYIDWASLTSTSRWSSIPSSWIKYAHVEFEDQTIVIAYSEFANKRVTLSFKDEVMEDTDDSRFTYFDTLLDFDLTNIPTDYQENLNDLIEFVYAPINNNFLDDYRSSGEAVCTGPAIVKPEIKLDGVVAEIDLDELPACVPLTKSCNAKRTCTKWKPQTIYYCGINGNPHYCEAADGGVRCVEYGIVDFCTFDWSPASNAYTLSVRPYLNGVAVGQKTTYKNKISPLEYYSLQLYSPNQSDEFLKERFDRLNTRLSEVSDPWEDPDETIGEFLHIAGRKYIRYLEEGNQLVGRLYGENAQTKDAVVMTSLRGEVRFVYDTPYAVFSDGYLVDAFGYQASAKLIGGNGEDAALSLGGISASAYETYIWQENAHVDAVSTVSGLQIAQDQDIEVATLTSAAALQSFLDICTTDPEPGVLPDCYLQRMADEIDNWFTGVANEKLTIPKKPIAVPGFTGYIYLGDKLNHKLYAIGPYKGGYSMPAYNNAFYSSGWNYTTTPTTNYSWNDFNITSNANYFSNGWSWDFSNTTYNWNALTDYSTIDSFNFSDYGVEYFTTNSTPSILSSAISTGWSDFSTWAGDPVNMVTGNMFHNETDFEIPARGLPLVFKRSYNSRDIAEDGPLGKGWNHSFNQTLKFVASEGATQPTEIIWTTSDGGKKFIKLDETIAFVGGVLNITADKIEIPDGYYFSVTRPHTSGQPVAEIVIREKNGITYRFQAVNGAMDDVAKLTAISDANGNQISLSYANDRLATVTDPGGRTLSFAYNIDNYLDTITLDWTGEVYRYTYNGLNLLESFRNPLDQDKNINTAFYTYYDGSEALNAGLRMKSFSDANGYTMTFTYYVNGRVYQHSDNQGNTRTFTYNDFRREAVSTDERGNKQHYIFNPHGSPLEIVEADGALNRYRYEDTDDKMLRTASVDAAGQETLIAYDDAGNITRETLPSGDTVEYFHYTTFGKPQLIKNTNGDYRLNLYDANGNLVDDIAFVSGYGAAINPATLTAGAFNPAPFASQILSWTFHSYDANGNRIRSRQVKDFTNRESGPYTSYDYTDTVNGTEGINPTQITYRGDIDGDGDIDASEGLGSYVFNYDARGRLTAGFNQQLYPVQYQYDASGRMVKGTDAAGQWRDYTYDDAGLLLTNTLAVVKNGIYTVIDNSANQYDEINRLASQTDGAGAITHYEYDAAGNIIKTTSPDGYTLSYEYDANNRLVAAYDEEGHTVRRQLDALGRLKALTDPNGNETTYSYYGAEENGRLRRITDAEGRWTEFAYDNVGQVTRTTAGRNTTTVSETLTSYDALGRVVRVVQSSYTDTVLGAVRPVTVYEYNSLGHNTAVRAGYTTRADGAIGSDVLTLQASYAYDDFGRLLTETNALGRVWRVTQYDVHGNALTRVDPNGNTTTSTYGYGGVLLTQSTTGPNAGASLTYTRNELNLPVTVASNNVTLSYGYDRAHRVASVTDSRDGKSVAYNYSMGGLLNKICQTENNTICDSADITTAYHYDPVGRLTAVRGPDNKVIQFSYDAGGRLRQKAFPNLVEEVYEYFNDNRLKSIAIRNRINHSNAAVLNYSYDDAGRTQTVNQNYLNAYSATATYGYDGLGRLTSAVANWYQESASYDPYGNRRQHTFNDLVNPQVVSVYQHNNQHQITSIRQNSASGPVLYNFNYDNNGNLRQEINNVAGQTTTFTYDGWDRLTAANHPSVAESYRYDHSRRRIGKTTAGVATNYLMSGPDIIAEYNSNWSTLQQHYTHGPRMDEPLMRMQGSNFSAVDYYHADALGSVVMMTAPVNTQANPPSIPVNNINFYTAWGLRSSLAPAAIQPYTFTGREADAVGQIYMRNRYYAPRFGRFTQPDPKGFIDGINTYAYVMNAPVNYVDPWGTVASSFSNTISSAGSYIGNSFTAGGNYFGDSWNSFGSSFAQEGQVPLVAGFIREEGLNVLLRTGQAIGGAGQMLLGGTICYGSGGLACAGGALIGAKGVDNFQAGIRGENSISQQFLVDVTRSEQAGILINAGLDLGTSAFGLLRSVPKINAFGNAEKSLLIRDPSLFEPAFRQTTRGALLIEGATSTTTIIDALD